MIKKDLNWFVEKYEREFFLKHKTQETYYGFIMKGDYISYYKLSKNSNKMDENLVDISKKYGKKELNTLLNKLLPKDYEVFDLPNKVKEETNAFIQNFKLDKDYFFVQKNEENILSSSIVKLNLKRETDTSWLLEKIPYFGNNVLPNLSHFVQGSLPLRRDVLYCNNVAFTLSYYLNLLFTLGFEYLSMEEVVNLCIPNPIEKDTVFDFKYYNFTQEPKKYIALAPNEALNIIKIVIYEVADNAIIKENIYYTICNKESTIADILGNFNDPEKFISIDKSILNKFEKKIDTEAFKIPQKEEVKLEQFPLEVPKEPLKISDFFNTLSDENKFYFYANMTPENPMEWQIAFTAETDREEACFLSSKPFLLKDFNAVSTQLKVEYLDDSSDKKSVERKCAREFKKAGLKPIETAKIYEILSGKPLNELNKQSLLCTFVEDDDESASVFDVYENYACVREGNLKHLYWQFFKDENERNGWLKKYKISETQLFRDDITFIAEHTEYYKNNANKFKNLKEDILRNPLLKSKFSDSDDIQKLIQTDVIIREATHIKGDFTLSEEILGSKKIVIFEGDLVVDGTLSITDNWRIYIIIKGDLKAKNIVKNLSIELLFIEGEMIIDNSSYPENYRIIIGNNQQIDYEKEEEFCSVDSKDLAFKAFKYALESFDVDNIELAGFKFIDNETQAKILGLYPPEDQLLRDERAKSGLYALIHADRPAYVKPNKTKKKGFEVASLDLLNRYSDLKSFMMETSNMYYKNIFYSLLENHTLSEIYESEKQYFNIDKELGLYWLIIFGLLNDKRYEEVEKDIAHFDWKMITGAKEYFKREEQNKISSAKEKMEFLNSLNLK